MSYARRCSCHSNRSTGCLGNWGTTSPRCRYSVPWRHHLDYRPPWPRPGLTTPAQHNQSLQCTKCHNVKFHFTLRFSN